MNLECDLFLIVFYAVSEGLEATFSGKKKKKKPVSFAQSHMQKID